MSKIYKMATATAMVASVVTLMTITGPASAATPPHRAATNYCLEYHEGGSDCGFTSMAQCEATASGTAAECFQNVYGNEGETIQW
jgi:Protein of unknown function (DUF3551)